jgi:hypothetical protein
VKIAVVVLVGGTGERFQRESPDFPKPLIRVAGRSQLFWATRGAFLSYSPNYFIFAVRSGLVSQISAEVKGFEFLKNYEVVDVGGATSGAAQTLRISLEKTAFNLEGVQIVSVDNDCFNLIDHPLTINDFPFVTITESINPHHCFVDLSTSLTVNKFYEKEIYGNLAVSGNYGFSTASQFLSTCARLDTSSTNSKESFMSDVVQLLAHVNLIKAIPLRAYFSLGTPHEISILDGSIENYV